MPVWLWIPIGFVAFYLLVIGAGHRHQSARRRVARRRPR